MKKLLILFAGLLILNLSEAQEKINWMTWDEAVAQSKKDSKPKKMFVDLYTGWCGWCKKMDESTFTNPDVVKYMNEHFYAVKFDAECRDTIVFNGTTFINSEPGFVKTAPNARGRVHILAYSLLDGQLSYPSYVILDENFNRATIIAGFKEVTPFMSILTFFGTNEYKNYQQYLTVQFNKQLQQQSGQK
jgi:thioredoxin-related protein